MKRALLFYVFAWHMGVQVGVLSFLLHPFGGSYTTKIPQRQHRSMVLFTFTGVNNDTFAEFTDMQDASAAYLNESYRLGQLKPLLQWAVDSGVDFCPGMEMDANASGDWSVVLTIPQELGAAIMTIPSNLVLSSNDYFGTPVFRWMQQNIEDTQYFPECLLVLRLLEELSRGEASPWYIWLQSLPTSFLTGLDMDEVERSHLQRMAPQFLEQQDRQWETCSQIIIKLANDQQSRISPTFQQWLLQDRTILSNTLQWAFSTVFTRSWRTPDGQQATIVPMGDLFNHDSQLANLRPCVRQEDRALQLCLTIGGDATATCSTDEPAMMYLSYGMCHQPARFLVLFGFFDASTPYVDAQLDRYLARKDLPPLSDDTAWPPFDPSQLVVSTQNGGIGEDVWNLLLLKILKDRDPTRIENIQAAYDQDDDAALQQLFDELLVKWESTVASELREHVQDLLDNIYPSIVRSEQDLVIHPRLCMILNYNDFMRNTFLQAFDLVKTYDQGSPIDEQTLAQSVVDTTTQPPTAPTTSLQTHDQASPSSEQTSTQSVADTTTQITPTTAASVQVTAVTTLEDWNALADVRFDEWIQEDGRTSRQAFRSATVDIYQEERPRSRLFLAKTKDDRVVGAAELSPYEVEPALAKESPFSVRYVTDVVTCRAFRRQGIARILMLAMEVDAAQDGITHLLLNVAYDNAAAVRFYGTLGYRVPTVQLLSHLNTECLSDQAGTHGQILYAKQLGGEE